MQQVGEVGHAEVGGGGGVARAGVEEQAEVGEHEPELVGIGGNIGGMPREQAAAPWCIVRGHASERPGGVTRGGGTQAIYSRYLVCSQEMRAGLHSLAWVERDARIGAVNA